MTKHLTADEQVTLFDAVNRFADSPKLSVARTRAVTDIVLAVEAIIAERVRSSDGVPAPQPASAEQPKLAPCGRPAPCAGCHETEWRAKRAVQVGDEVEILVSGEWLIAEVSNVWPDDGSFTCSREDDKYGRCAFARELADEGRDWRRASTVQSEPTWASPLDDEASEMLTVQQMQERERERETVAARCAAEKRAAAQSASAEQPGATKCRSCGVEVPAGVVWCPRLNCMKAMLAERGKRMNDAIKEPEAPAAEACSDICIRPAGHGGSHIDAGGRFMPREEGT